MNLLSVVVLNYNTRQLLKNCLQSIFKNSSKEVFVYVVDNASSDGSVEMARNLFPKVKIFQNNKNLGFSAGNNTALKKIDSKYYLLLNSDTEVLKDSVQNLIEFAGSFDYGIISPKLIYKNGSFQPNAGDLPFGLALFNWISGLDDLLNKFSIRVPSFHRNDLSFYSEKSQVGWVSATAMLIKKDVLKRIGFLDENIFMYGEDTEYCLRAGRAGFKIGWTNKAEIIHIQGGSLRDAKFRQWLGEFKGLIYIYKKYTNFFYVLILKILIYKFIIIRAIIFFLKGQKEVSKTYAKIIFSI